MKLLRLLKTPHTLCCTALLGLSLQAAAQETPAVVTEMRSLIDQGNFREAYLLAQEDLFENEGDPEFDFYYGLAALESGRPDEAVFAFERIAFAFPNQRRVKLELARAYYMSNNLAAAEDLFNEVLETNPEPNVTANINAFLEVIEERQSAVRSTLSWFVNSNVGSDSNINSATELGVISLPIGDVELNPNGQKIDDFFMDLGGGFIWSYPLDKNRSFGVSGTYNKHNNLDTSQFDLDTVSLEASYSRINGNQRISPSVRHQRVWLDQEGFQNSTSLLGSWQRSGGNGWSQALTGALTAVRYDDSPSRPDNHLRDVDQALLSGVLSKASGSLLHSVSLYYGDESSVHSIGSNNAQQFYGIALSEQFQLSAAHLPYLRVSLHRSNNKDTDNVFNVDREDNTFSATLGWIWRLGSRFNLNSDLTFTENDSNIELYEYDRLKYQAGFRYSF